VWFSSLCTAAAPFGSSVDLSLAPCFLAMLTVT
jgi:hypothetical protein